MSHSFLKLVTITLISIFSVAGAQDDVWEEYCKSEIIERVKASSCSHAIFKLKSNATNLVEAGGDIASALGMIDQAQEIHDQACAEDGRSLPIFCNGGANSFVTTRSLLKSTAERTKMMGQDDKKQVISDKILSAKQGDVESLKWLVTAAKSLVAERARRNTANEFWDFGPPHKNGIENSRLSQRSTAIYDAITEISDEATLELANYCLTNIEKDIRNQNQYLQCIFQVSRAADYNRSKDRGKPSENRLDQFGEIILANAMLINSSTTRGISSALDFIRPLTLSKYEDVRVAAIELEKIANAEYRGAPSPNDDLGAALGRAIVQSWFTPLRPNQKDMADTLADELTMDLLLK